MHKKKRIMFQGAGLLAVTVLTVSCSSPPLSRGHLDYYGAVKDTHAYVRNEQDNRLDGKFASLDQSLNMIEQRLAGDECYRIVSSSTQWGILEPQMIFQGESVAQADKKVFIFVAPLFHDKDHFPTPADTQTTRVFRIDQDAPHSAALIRQLEMINGNADHCVTLQRWEQEDESRPDHPVISAQIISVSRLKKSRKEPEQKKEAAPTAAPAEATPAAPATDSGKTSPANSSPEL